MQVAPSDTVDCWGRLAVSHPLLHAGATAGPAEEPLLAMNKFAGYIKSGDTVPVGWYNLPDGSIF